jgi:hypothetical protein
MTVWYIAPEPADKRIQNSQELRYLLSKLTHSSLYTSATYADMSRGLSRPVNPNEIEEVEITTNNNDKQTQDAILKRLGYNLKGQVVRLSRVI